MTSSDITVSPCPFGKPGPNAEQPVSGAVLSPTAETEKHVIGPASLMHSSTNDLSTLKEQLLREHATDLSFANSEFILKEAHSQPLTTESLLASTLRFVKKYDQKKLQMVFNRIDPVLSHIKSFSSIIDIYVQTNPAISGLIWGSLHLAIAVSLIHLWSWMEPANSRKGVLSIASTSRKAVQVT
jgi:hypothetical protein